MDQTYYDTVSRLENMKVSREYMLGWMGGYLQNPMREEQRVTEAYESGYADGGKGTTDSAENWLEK
jgi:hypothetical protein